jgi:hypothetical protein
MDEGVHDIFVRRVPRRDHRAVQPHLVADVQRADHVVADGDLQVDDGHINYLHTTLRFTSESAKHRWNLTNSASRALLDAFARRRCCLLVTISSLVTLWSPLAWIHYTVFEQGPTDITFGDVLQLTGFFTQGYSQSDLLFAFVQ